MDQRSINDTHLLVALINHRLDRSVVELFTLLLPKTNESVDKLKLVHLRTVYDESVYAPNAVALVDAAGSFYVTNDHKYTSVLYLFHDCSTQNMICRYHTGVMRVLEEWLQWSGASLHFHNANSTQWTRVGGVDLQYANGVAVSPKTHDVFVVQSLGRRLTVFHSAGHQRSRSAWEQLSVQREIALPFM